MYKLKNDNDNDQKDLATQSETTEFAQLQEEEDRIVVLKDIKILAKKEEIFFLHAQLIEEGTDITRRNQTAVRIQAKNS